MRALFVIALVAMIVVASVEAGKKNKKNKKHHSTPAPGATTAGNDRAGAQRAASGNPRFRAPQAAVPHSLDDLVARAKENSGGR
ncbi:hypothetical protein WR25_21574 [Diploscapter pachys]|uniref:Uncharacterized protein n=1 Tax=Diploscapter pachys TaxID=2018661 RepID=A0A2A2KQ28_9BILA|nr:hypothetical protein WR25_21574 [Diploscapter pachys]